jgi:UDP-N-acetylmuramyl pentapeptide synthase
LYSEITGFNSKPLTKEMLAAILEKHFWSTQYSSK